MKLFTKTFGCQMNFADSEEMERHLQRRGFTSAETLEDAHAVLINTCTVRDMAEHKAASYIGRLREWKAITPERRILVTGCAAERAKATLLRKFPHIDLIVGALDIEKFPSFLDGLFPVVSKNGGGPSHDVDTHRLAAPFAGPEADIDGIVLQPSTARMGQPSNALGFVTVMRGCNHRCTFCIVPSVRGRESYRPLPDILGDVQKRVAEGAGEIWLLGQTVNSYKDETGGTPADFADLLRAIDRVPGLKRLRFTSPHPAHVTDRMIQAMAECETVCEHLHLPVQSGSTDILTRMRRGYTRDGFLRVVARLRAAIPNISITTDFISGFCGETDEDHRASLSLIDHAGFDAAFCFAYSPRPGTDAALWPDDVPTPVKDERLNALLDKTNRDGVAAAERLIGTRQQVYVEELRSGGVVRGRTRSFWKVRLPLPGARAGDLIDVRVSDHHSRELHAVPCGAIDQKG